MLVPATVQTPKLLVVRKAIMSLLPLPPVTPLVIWEYGRNTSRDRVDLVDVVAILKSILEGVRANDVLEAGTHFNTIALLLREQTKAITDEVALQCAAATINKRDEV